ncbi:MAG: hypothetical protein DRI48_03785 [Chloroflexi bacterium]|nr:MAG: hypothetical protein DRI48_03785 [Chloroflexota bacterium]
MMCMMEHTLTTSLNITAVGMLTLFSALALLYGLMYLLTWITGLRTPTGERSDVEEPHPDNEKRRDDPSKQRVAAIAVALARAELEAEVRTNVASPAGATGKISPWWALHHQRRLTLNQPPPRGR